jgi:hypothetical protein
MLETEIHFIAVIQYVCTSKKGHTKMLHLNTHIQLNTRFMFKMEIFVFKFLNTGVVFKFKHRLHVFFLESRNPALHECLILSCQRALIKSHTQKNE